MLVAAGAVIVLASPVDADVDVRHYEIPAGSIETADFRSAGSVSSSFTFPDLHGLNVSESQHWLDIRVVHDLTGGVAQTTSLVQFTLHEIGVGNVWTNCGYTTRQPSGSVTTPKYMSRICPGASNQGNFAFTPGTQYRIWANHTDAGGGGNMRQTYFSFVLHLSDVVDVPDAAASARAELSALINETRDSIEASVLGNRSLLSTEHAALEGNLSGELASTEQNIRDDIAGIEILVNVTGNITAGSGGSGLGGGVVHVVTDEGSGAGMDNQTFTWASATGPNGTSAILTVDAVYQLTGNVGATPLNWSFVLEWDGEETPCRWHVVGHGGANDRENHGARILCPLALHEGTHTVRINATSIDGADPVLFRTYSITLQTSGEDMDVNLTTAIDGFVPIFAWGILLFLGLWWGWLGVILFSLLGFSNATFFEGAIPMSEMGIVMWLVFALLLDWAFRTDRITSRLGWRLKDRK